MNNLLQEIIFSGKKVVFVVEPSGIEEILKYTIPVLTSFLGIYVVKKISEWKEKRRFRRTSHLKYLEVLNELIYEINKLIMDINNIKEFGTSLLKEGFNEFDFRITDSYASIAYKIFFLKKN